MPVAQTFLPVFRRPVEHRLPGHCYSEPLVLRQPVSAAWTLSLIYAAAVVAHIAALAPGSRFPHLSTDEAQYVSVGENLRLGHGFTVRGYFHSGIPPVYPLFVAAAHAIGGPSRFTMLCWNSAAIC